MNPYLFPALGMTPQVLASLFRQSDAPELDTPTEPGRFTPREVAAHLADWEPILLVRMQQCVSSPGSELTPYDEGKMAIENNYAGSDLDERLAAFAGSRRATIAWLKTVSPEGWAMSAYHPERGRQSVYDIANMLVCHDVYHIEQILGK